MEGGLVFVQVVQVEIEKPCRFIYVFVIQWNKTISKIERYSSCIGINREESTTSLVVGSEIQLDKVQQRAANAPSLSY